MDTLPLAIANGWGCGISCYAVVVITGLVGRTGAADTPAVLQRTDVLAAAAVLLAIELVADKIPYVDSGWDTVHTVIRPTLAAVLGALLAGEADDLGEAVAAVLGGSTALASHAAKASLRLAVNASPEPFSNIALSLAENTAVVGVLLLAIEHPWAALAVAAILLALAALLAVLLMRAMRRGWSRLINRLATKPRDSL
jgi:hypothetical protein